MLDWLRLRFKNIKLDLVILLLLVIALSGCGQIDRAASSTDRAPTTASAQMTILVAPEESEASEAPEAPEIPEAPETSAPKALAENGHYTSPEDVAAYLHVYQKLPSNFITKREAMDLGWESEQGNLWEVTDELSIGGDRFGNREGLLPPKSGRIYYECDVNYEGGFRGDERLVFSNDGLIFYTDDHYQTFTQLY